LRIDIWSDVVCPWCYIGKRRLEAALARFVHADEVEIAWHAFELDAAAPPAFDATRSQAERLAKKYRTSIAGAEAMMNRVATLAKADGLDLRLVTVRTGNTFHLHRILQLALERGIQGAVMERLFRAHFTENEPLGDPDAVVRVVSEAGLLEADVRAVLSSDAHAEAVRADEQQARQLGARGVPFYVLDGRLGLEGAQPVEVMLGALDEAWAERASGDNGSPNPA
jgi:predicted DsbA family dithiol-disulfide isomerase